MQQDSAAGESKPAADRNRVSELDLLRFFAALAVVLFHYSFRGYFADGKTVMPYLELAPIGKYGYLGVDLFFFISGFVIWMTASRGGLRQFFVSRVARLYPAYWICCSITFVAILSIGGARYQATTAQYLANMTMLNSFFHVPYIDGAYWSLAVELRFYALVALVLLFGALARAQALLCVWLAGSIALQFRWIDWIAYVLIADYSAYFIAGATCFLIWSQGMTALRALMLILSWLLALANAIQYARGIAQHFRTPVSEIAVAAIVSVFFLIMLLVALRSTGFIGRTRWLTLGALTYPLYLLHQNIGFMLFNLGYPRFDANLLFWGTIVLVLTAAYLVHTQIERRCAPPLKQGLNRALAALASPFNRSAAHTRA